MTIKRIIARASLLVAIFLIIFFSIVPDPLPETIVTFMDKIKHFIAYGTLGFLCVASYVTQSNKARTILFSILFCFALGVTMECVQFFVHRTPDVMDAASNLCGGIGGSFGALFLRKYLAT